MGHKSFEDPLGDFWNILCSAYDNGEVNTPEDVERLCDKHKIPCADLYTLRVRRDITSQGRSDVMKLLEDTCEYRHGKAVRWAKNWTFTVEMPRRGTVPPESIYHDDILDEAYEGDAGLYWNDQW